MSTLRARLVQHWLVEDTLDQAARAYGRAGDADSRDQLGAQSSAARGGDKESGDYAQRLKSNTPRHSRS